MKLMRHGPKGQEKPALIDRAGRVRDLSGVAPDITAAMLSKEGLENLRALDIDRLRIIEPHSRVAPPYTGIGKFIGVGLNYVDHAAEANATVPAEPILFLKSSSTVIGANDPVVLPQDSVKSDWEVELGVVIGTTARYVPQADALNHVAGYCVVNDLSERAFQLERGGQWDKGKNCDTFGPIGPWLVTSDEVPDPQGLALWLEVNGRRYQDGNTGNMIFGVA